VAEGARLESVYTFTGIGGSNPSLSASLLSQGATSMRLPDVICRSSACLGSERFNLRPTDLISGGRLRGERGSEYRASLSIQSTDHHADQSDLRPAAVNE
jgi:hypothetical protein